MSKAARVEPIGLGQIIFSGVRPSSSPGRRAQVNYQRPFAVRPLHDRTLQPLAAPDEHLKAAQLSGRARHGRG
jgi:hypothetical protein